MKKREIVKTVAGVVVTTGVSIIVGNVVRGFTPADANKVVKGLVLVGGFALSGMIGDHTAKYVETMIDDTADQLSGVMAEVQTAE